MTQPRQKILIVDDEPSIRKLLSELLQRDGYTVKAAKDALEALRLLAVEDFQMVISDLRMPGMDGFELIERIKSQKPDIAAIMITAYATIETAVQALRHGADDYITKPFEINELKKVIGKTFETRKLARQNRVLVDQLKQANDELVRHRRQLEGRAARSSETPEEASRRLAKTVARLDLVNEISQAISSHLDLKELLEACLQQINEKFNVGSSSIMLLDDNRTHLIVRASSRDEIIGHRQRVGERVSGWVAKYKEPLLIEDIRRNRRFQPSGYDHYKTHSLLSIPLMARSKLLGVINITDRQNENASGKEARFSEEEVELLKTIAVRIAAAIENAGKYGKIKNDSFNAIAAIAEAVDGRQSTSMGHSSRVTEIAVRLAHALKLDDAAIDLLRTACRVHDIGKLAISDGILTKSESLNKQEMNYVRSHSVKGDRILQSLSFLDRARRVVRHHHEHWNGAGYPDGLKGEEIPLLSRILALADAWDAMTSDRPYRPARSHADALREIEHGAGEQFDPEIVPIFLALQKKAASRSGARMASQPSGSTSAPA